MRSLVLAVPLSVALCPLAAQADVFPVVSAPKSVVVHPNVARVSRSFALDLPAGRHEVRLSDLPGAIIPNLTEINISGAVLEARVFRDFPTSTPESLAGTPEVQAARSAVQQANEALAKHDDRVAEVRASAQAAQAQIAFLEGLQIERLSLDIDGLRALGQTIASDGTAARSAIVAAEAEARQLQFARQDLQDAVILAEATLARVIEPFENANELSLMVNVPQAGSTNFDIEYWVRSVEWNPVYRMELETEAAALRMERSVSIQQFTGEPWIDVELQVTTIPAGGQTIPNRLFPQLLTSVDAAELNKRLVVQSRSSEYEESDNFADPFVEAPVLLEDNAAAGASFSGAGVVYAFDVPITVRGQEAALVSLEALDFAVEIAARAVPSSDETAFRMIDFTNETGERILAGSAVGFVDGQAIGRIELETIEAGAEVETGFGPIHGLQLKRATLDKQEGDRGIIARENALREEVRISIENLTNKTWEVTLADKVPYSEQESLDISWSAAPRPAREDVEDERGILEWDLTVASGAVSEIRLESNIRWPDGEVLR